jgi:hypothetical protein
MHTLHLTSLFFISDGGLDIRMPLEQLAKLRSVPRPRFRVLWCLDLMQVVHVT